MSDDRILLSEKRQLVPRWHTSRKLYQLSLSPNLDVERGVVSEEQLDLESSELRWRSERSPSAALDLIARYRLGGKSASDEVRAAEAFLVSDRRPKTPTFTRFLQPNLRLFDSSETYATRPEERWLLVRRIRRHLREHPNDALSWLDLAFYLMSLGESSKARKSVVTGLALAPNHPQISRFAARFLVGTGDPEAALGVLKKTKRTRENPLIASGFLAIADQYGLQIPNVKPLRRLLGSHEDRPYLISDLAAAMATLEFSNGAAKRGKELMEVATRSPSENTIAQLSWLHHKHGLNLQDLAGADRPSLEANATELYAQMRFRDCREQLMDLFSFQPFNAGPLVDAGYVSILGIQDPEFVVSMSEHRLPISKIGFQELNNLIVAKALLGQVEPLAHYIQLLTQKCVREDESQFATLLATSGLVAFAHGLAEEGTQLYEASLEILSRTKNDKGEALAKYFLSGQLQDTDPVRAEKLRSQAQKIANRHNLPELKAALTGTTSSTLGRSE